MEDFLAERAPFQTSESHYAIARPYLPYCYYYVQNATGADRYNLRNYESSFCLRQTLHNMYVLALKYSSKCSTNDTSLYFKGR